MLAVDSTHSFARAGWLLRAARPSDLGAVSSLLALCSLPTEGVAEQFGESYAVAEHAGEIVGVAGVERHGPHGLLRSVAVAPQWRLAGVGSALVRDRLQWSEEAGMRSLFLLTTDAARYFHRYGFRVVARDVAPAALHASREFSEICPASARLMRLEEDAALLGAGDECCGGNCPCKDTSANDSETDSAPIRDAVREKYAKAARDAAQGDSSCCGGGCECSNPVTGGLYDAAQVAEIPEQALRASLGCGNPTLLAELREGETVLDLGSGGGIDVLLSARRVGASGFAYGIDMTDEMLALARDNQRKAGIANVEFRKGEIESLPFAEASVDVIISNCVINLSGDKPRVLAEAFRVLKPGGRFAVSDVVVRREIPASIRRDVELWAGCVAGALEEWKYREFLQRAGFTDIEVVPTRIYSADDMRENGVRDSLPDGALMSAFIRATKPAKEAVRRA